MVHRVLEKKQNKTDACSASKSTALYGEEITLSPYTQLLALKFVQVFFYEILSDIAFLPASIFPLASRRQAKHTSGTSWPDQVALTT